MKLLFALPFVFLLFLSGSIYSQPIQRWQKIYDGIGWYDVPTDMCKDNFGNYIVAGTSVVSNINFSDYQIVYLKYDALGNQLWLKTKNNSSSVVDEPYKIFLDDSSNFYSIGNFAFSGYIAKYDQSGNEIWFNIDDGFKDLEIDNLGNIIAAYSANNHAYVRKYNKDGLTIWTKRFDSLSTMMSESVNLVNDENHNFYLLGNKVVSVSNSNFFIMKFDTDGNRIWYREFDTQYQKVEWMEKLVQDSQNNLIVIGIAEVPNQYKDIYLVKISEDGDFIWNQYINGEANYYDYPYDVAIDSENNIIVSGYISKDLTYSTTINQFITAKFDKAGNTVFKKIYCDSISLRGTGRLLQVDSEKNIYCAGTISIDSLNEDNKILILKYDQLGNLIWEIQKDVYSGGNYPIKMILNNEDDFTMTAHCGGQVMPGNIVTFRYSDQPLTVENIKGPYNYSLKQNFPNPFNPLTTISYSIPKTSNVKIIVYDILGNEIKTLMNAEKIKGEYQIQFDPTGLSSGVYFYSIVANDFTEIKKMILIK